MSERFTDRSRKVMALANQEAQRLNHEYIGAEHIFLGLLKEGSGAGATVLRNCDVDLLKARTILEKLFPSGPDMVTMGKLPQTTKANEIIEYSVELARRLGDNYVGTEHLLYSFIMQEGTPRKILNELNLKPNELEKELLDLLEKDIKKYSLLDTLGYRIGDYWKIPKRDINLSKFLEISLYKIKLTRGTDSQLKTFKIEDHHKIQVGRFDLAREDSIEHKAPTVIYNLDDKEQIKYALDLRDLFNVNMVKYQEEPPASEVLRELRKPLGDDIVSLVNRLEKKG